MKSKEEIKAFMDFFLSREGDTLQFDEEAIVLAYQKDSNSQSLAIKVLSVFGGLLASLMFLGFLFLAGLYNSDVALLVAGGVFIAGSIWVNKKYDNIIIDTVSISFFIIGFILVGVGGEQLRISNSGLSVIFIVIALGSLSIVRSYILSFLSVLIINGSVITLIISGGGYDFIHVYVSVLALIVTYIFLKEAKIVTRNSTLSKLYNPVKAGVIFSFLAGLMLLSNKWILSFSPYYIWLSSVVIILVIVYLVSRLFTLLNIKETRSKVGIYSFSVLALLPTIISPAISGAILILLLGFMANYKIGLVLGIIVFVYSTSQYYYDLDFTLLTKSILLFSTGVLFITLYLLTYKQLTSDEKE